MENQLMAKSAKKTNEAMEMIENKTKKEENVRKTGHMFNEIFKERNIFCFNTAMHSYAKPQK